MTQFAVCLHHKMIPLQNDVMSVVHSTSGFVTLYFLPIFCVYNTCLNKNLSSHESI